MLFSKPHIDDAFLFEPYHAKAFRSDAKHRQKRTTQEGIYTCWEINSASSAWKDLVPCCAPCGRFKAEKAIKNRLRKLVSNQEAVKAYRCDTLWKQYDSANQSNFISTQSSERPTKRRITSHDTIEVTPLPVDRPCLPPPPPTKTAKSNSQPFDLKLQQV